MKRCQYCGKCYADKVTVCPADGYPLVNPGAIPGPATDRTAFSAALTSRTLPSGQYRIYVRGDDLIFIQVEAAAHSVLDSIHGFLGPFGALIPLATWAFSKHRPKGWTQRLETADPEDLIRDDEKNFRLHLSEIREATMDAVPYWRLSAKSAVRLDLLVRQNEKMKLALATSADVETARQLFASRLPAVFKVNVEWSEADQRFQKKEAHTPA